MRNLITTLALCCASCLNAAAQEIPTSPLAGKTIHVIGDSYVRNHRRPFTETWHYKAATALGMTYNNYGRNGGCIAFDRSSEGFGPSILQRYVTMSDTADIVLVIAGHNDADKIRGNADSIAIFRDSLNALCQGLIHKYPRAKIAFVTPWNVPRAGFSSVIQTMKEVCAEHSIPILDAAATSGIHVRDEAFRRRYFQAPHDTAHLNAEGHDLLVRWGMQFLLRL